MVVYLIHKISS